MLRWNLLTVEGILMICKKIRIRVTYEAGNFILFNVKRKGRDSFFSMDKTPFVIEIHSCVVEIMVFRKTKCFIWVSHKKHVAAQEAVNKSSWRD